jgi:PKD repeat protein
MHFFKAIVSVFSNVSAERRSAFLIGAAKYWMLSLVMLVSISSFGQNFVKPTFFGFHANAGQWPTVPWGAYRTWDAGVRWVLQNPSAGSYNWTTLDYELDGARATGAQEFMYTFGVVPQWASTNPWGTGCDWSPSGCYMPVMSAWTAFVQALAQHSGNRKAAGKPGITIYELWNEPDASNYWRGTPAQLAQLAAAAYPLIHQYDPSAKVASGAPQGTYAWKWLEAYMAAGAARYTDQIDYHGYVGARMPEAGIDNVNRIKQLAVNYGLSSKPLQDTEGFWWTLTGTTTQTAWFARKYLLDASQGVSAFYWYSWNHGSKMQGTYLIGVYNQLHSWMVGRTVYPCVQNSSVWTCVIKGNAGWTGMAVWNTAGSSQFSVPSQFTGWQDLFGGSHGVSGSSVAINVIPILLTGSGSVDAPPTAVLSLSPSSGTLPLNVMANGTASHDSNGKPVVRSTINFGDGTTTNGLTASHIYQRAGTFAVTLSVWDSNGLSDTASSSVSVNSVATNRPPIARLSLSATHGPAPVTVNASTSASSDPDGTVVSSVINFGDGTVLSGPRASHTYNKAGTYTVTATVRDNQGASAVARASIKVPGPSKTDFDLNATPESVSTTSLDIATYRLKVTPAGTLDTPVALSCIKVPAHLSCVFTPNKVTPGGKPAVSKLGVRSSGQSAALSPRNGGSLLAFWLPLPGIALLGAGIGKKKSKRARGIVLAVLVMIVVISQLGCGGASVVPGANPSDAQGLQSVTVLAQSGTHSHTIQIYLRTPHPTFHR